MFLHFGLLHIALNMWVLIALGPQVERLFGSACYLLLYLFSGLCGSVASLWWHPGINSAGASGAIFGVIAGLLAFTLNPATRLPASITGNQRTSALVFIFYNLANGFGHQGIDNACHVGGLLGGLLMGWLLAQPWIPKPGRSNPSVSPSRRHSEPSYWQRRSGRSRGARTPPAPRSTSASISSRSGPTRQQRKAARASSIRADSAMRSRRCNGVSRLQAP